MAILSNNQIEKAEQIDAVPDLVREFTDFALSLDPNAKSAYSSRGLEEQLASLPGILAPSKGAFLLVAVDGVPTGCVAYFGHRDGVCEVKRM